MDRGYLCDPEQYLEDREEPLQLRLARDYTQIMHVYCHEDHLGACRMGWECYLNTAACRQETRGELEYNPEKWDGINPMFDSWGGMYHYYNSQSGLKIVTPRMIICWSSTKYREEEISPKSYTEYIATAGLRNITRGESEEEIQITPPGEKFLKEYNELNDAMHEAGYDDTARWGAPEMANQLIPAWSATEYDIGGSHFRRSNIEYRGAYSRYIAMAVVREASRGE